MYLGGLSDPGEEVEYELEQIKYDSQSGGEINFVIVLRTETVG